MDTRYLQSFVAVAELGSMAEAARQLDLTPAAIAARVKALEEDIGLALVKRSGRSVRPTEAGLKMLDRARNVLRDVRDLRAASGDGLSLGELRLGVFASAATSVLPPVLKRLYERFPELSVFVAPGNSVELCRQVTTGALDAAIVVEPQFAVGKGCAWQALLEERLVVVAPASMANRTAHELLATEPFIRYDRSVLGGQLADRYLRDQGIEVRQRLEIDSLMAVAALVDQGLGVALLPDWAPMWNSALDIVRVPLPARAPVRRVGLVWAAHGPRAALSKALLAEAQAVCGEGRRGEAAPKRERKATGKGSARSMPSPRPSPRGRGSKAK
jgi:DNA-binding transcriptional LysR family regulator